MPNPQTDSVQLFFQQFRRHLERIRDDGEQKVVQRAQILIGQLREFEKAVMEDSANPRHDRLTENAFQAFMLVKDLEGFAQWLDAGQRLFDVLGLFFLGGDAKWNRLTGNAQLPDPVRVNHWCERGLFGRIEGADNAYLIYLYGVPRLALFLANPGQRSPGDMEAFVGFLARVLPLFLTSKVREEPPPVSTRFQGKLKMVARDPAFLDLVQLIERAAQKDVTILLEGESGTGKEVLAEMIHANSGRAQKPLITVNCAAIPAGLIESELFGHEKGSFTGAVQRHIGSVERANGGTLFLDEIGEREISMQAKLLRFLQLREFHRVGGREKLSVNVRIVAATNRDLKEEIKGGRFREDLYYRLSVTPFRVPPLRERVEDIIPLARFFLTKYAAEFHMALPEIDERVFQLLAGYAFPGNIRQLENLIQKLLVLSPGKVSPHHLPPEIRKVEPVGAPVEDEEGNPRIWRRQASSAKKVKLPVMSAAGETKLPWAETIPEDNDNLKLIKQQIQDFAKQEAVDVERRFLEALLERAEGSIPEASRLAGINRTLLYKLIERTGLNLKEE